MSESNSTRPSLWLAALAVLVGATVWAAVAMGSTGSPASGAGSVPPSSASPPATFAATGDPHGHGNCPDEDGSGGSGSGNDSTPSAPNPPSTPSQQDGSSNPSL